MDNLYREFFRAKVISAIAHAKAVANLRHQGVKGQVLEILIGQLFVPLLPSDVGVGSGHILCSYTGRQSRQIDIILYNKAILPPLLLDGNLGVFPIESVLYTIEVKTKLTARELQSAHKSAEELDKKFGYRPGQKDADGKIQNHQIKKLHSIVFALNSDLKGMTATEAERYKKIYDGSLPWIRAICVAGKEYCFDSGERWISYKSDSNGAYDEVLAFIGGVCNTYRDVAESRGTPLLGNYLVPDIQAIVGPISKPPTSSSEPSGVPVRCEQCGLTSTFSPDIGKLNITINGSISATDPCPKCQGRMTSEPSSFTFKHGQLQSVSIADQLPANGAKTPPQILEKLEVSVQRKRKKVSAIER